MDARICDVCVSRLLRCAVGSLPPVGSSGSLSDSARLVLQAITPHGSCLLCLGLFEWLQSAAFRAVLDANLSGYECRLFSLELNLSATHMLREALCEQPLTSAVDWASSMVRPLLLARAMQEGQGGLSVALSDAGGPRDVLVLGEQPQQQQKQQKQGRKGGRGRKRGEREEGPPLLSKAKLSQLLTKSSAASLRDTVLRLAVGPCGEAAEAPRITVVREREREKRGRVAGLFFEECCLGWSGDVGGRKIHQVCSQHAADSLGGAGEEGGKKSLFSLKHLVATGRENRSFFCGRRDQQCGVAGKELQDVVLFCCFN
jgi:hypothetical protein